MGTVTILPETTRNPITLIGQRAGVCWGRPTDDDEANFRRGWSCIGTGHWRTLEYVNVEMVLDGYSARVIREWYTHIGGAPTRLQASTRRIDYVDFDYIVPKSVDDAGAEARVEYIGCMSRIRGTLERLGELGVPSEDVAMLLPMGMATRIVDKRNLRSLVDMSRQRMCMKAYWEYRQMFQDISKALREYSPEWESVVDCMFMPKCDITGYCSEKESCGRHNHTPNDASERWGL